jgi:hypothetical protein
MHDRIDQVLHVAASRLAVYDMFSTSVKLRLEIFRLAELLAASFGIPLLATHYNRARAACVLRVVARG